MYFHGWPGSRLQAAMAHAEAKRLGLHLVAPDRPGMGASSHRKGRRMQDWPVTVGHLADYLGWEQFNILAVSGGGPYAQACGALIAERLIKVGICSGVPRPNWIRERNIPPTLHSRIVKANDQIGLVLPAALLVAKSFLRLSTGPGSARAAMQFLEPVDRQALHDYAAFDIVLGSVREAFRGPISGLKHDLDIICRDWEFDAALISVPVVFWHGKLDKICPIDQVREAAARIPGSRLTVFSDDGHYSLPFRHTRHILEAFV